MMVAKPALLRTHALPKFLPPAATFLPLLTSPVSPIAPFGSASSFRSFSSSSLYVRAGPTSATHLSCSFLPSCGRQYNNPANLLGPSQCAGFFGAANRRESVALPSPLPGSPRAGSNLAPTWNASAQSELQSYFATCAPGLEAVLAQELASPFIRARNVQAGRAGVAFQGGQDTGYRASIWLRTSTRVLLLLSMAPLNRRLSPGDSVYEFVRGCVDWSEYIEPEEQPGRFNGPGSDLRPSRTTEEATSGFWARGTWEGDSEEGGLNFSSSSSPSSTSVSSHNTYPSSSTKARTFSVDSRVAQCSNDLTSERLASLRAKDAICDAIREAYGRKPLTAAESASPRVLSRGDRYAYSKNGGQQGERDESGRSEGVEGKSRRNEAPRAMGGGPPQAELPLFLVLFQDMAMLYRDLSGRSLHKRGYRQAMHRASLSEDAAAGVLLMAGWDKRVRGAQAEEGREGEKAEGAAGTRRSVVLLDPMCGSGTFLIEAALIACRVAPGLLRKGQWPFEHWHDFDPSLWSSCVAEAESWQCPLPPGILLLGNDIHPGALSLCERDAEAAGVGHLIHLTQGDCKDCRIPKYEQAHREQSAIQVDAIHEQEDLKESSTAAKTVTGGAESKESALPDADFTRESKLTKDSVPQPGSELMVVTNPPWGIRLQEEENSGAEHQWLADTWFQLGSFLKRECPKEGANAYILSGNPSVTQKLFMRAESKQPLLVGGIECRVLHYKIRQPKPTKENGVANKAGTPLNGGRSRVEESAERVRRTQDWDSENQVTITERC